MVPDSAFKAITGGPNDGYAYMLSMYTENPLIMINRAALDPNGAFVQGHPVTAGFLCSRAIVAGLAPDIERHEGTTQQTNSHTDLLFRKLDTYTLGPIVEQVVGELAVTHFEVGARIGVQRDAAIDSAAFGGRAGHQQHDASEQLQAKILGALNVI
jgi:hypothetical protein